MSNSDALQQLSEKEELLLVKYIDGECGLFEKMKAKKLLNSSSLAQNFVSSLKVLSQDFASTQDEFKNFKVDLWDKIAYRIEQEEKAAFYLGSRATAVQEQPRLIDWSKINLGLGTGLVAASLALFFIYGNPLNPQFVKSSSEIANNISPIITDDNRNFNQVNFVNASQSDFANAPQARDLQIPTSRLAPSKVDWVRSHGRVRMIKNSEKRLPTIWVSRSLPSRMPNPQLFDVESGRMSQNPIIIEDRAPRSISVINSK